MSNPIWADCWGGKSPIELIDHGYKGVSCYISPTDGQPSSKDATPAQVAAYRAAGLDVVLNWESTGTSPLGGYNVGVAEAHTALQMAEARGYPAGMVIVFSADFEVTAAQIGAVCAYLDGTKAGLAGRYATGIYGDAWVLDETVGGGHASFGWQTSSWSFGRISSHANFLQYAYGQEFDSNTLLVPTASLWGITPVTAPTKKPVPKPAPKPPAPKPAPKPVTPPAAVPNGEEMELVEATGLASGTVKDNQVYIVTAAGKREIFGKELNYRITTLPAASQYLHGRARDCAELDAIPDIAHPA